MLYSSPADRAGRYAIHSSKDCAKPNSTNAMAVIASHVMERTMIDFMSYLAISPGE
jgi:predicted transcriptional regulator of viral defense system